MCVDVHRADNADCAEEILHLPFLVASLVHSVPPGERACQESCKGRGGVRERDKKAIKTLMGA